MALGIKEEHSKLFPGYSYRPRKSADKKRRMTITKAAQVNALAEALVSKNDSVNNDFIPELTKPKPVLVEEKYGNQNVSSFELGDPNITAKELRTLITNNNKKFLAGPTNGLHHDAPAILAAAPSDILEDDYIVHLAASPWGVYNSAHQLDGGELDREFASAITDDTIDPVQLNGFGGKAELHRQYRLGL